MGPAPTKEPRSTQGSDQIGPDVKILEIVEQTMKNKAATYGVNSVSRIKLTMK